ncbi:hypothetical protein [Serinibacter salmoneus]|uniref:YrhK-like protein n=1 Tax=Serinibacter salmoneus TaxID=556530 RepID=A0A2A9D0U4_9MICO|nr:hypothetical protein [Serinibacter salmoneus]PFG20263.1 hypothetical protein ATL40_1860 [Serinibacter salmoneus]
MSRRRPSTREPITRDVLVRRTGLTFVIGSALFALGVLLQLPPHWPAIIGGLSYAVGAVFFTTAGFMQIALAVRDLSIDKRARLPRGGWSGDLVAAVVQSFGTVLFNVNTIDYVLTLDSSARVQDVAVWVPDTVGSIAFLVSSGISLVPAVRALRHQHVPDRSDWIAWINMAGSVLFGISAVASFTFADGDPVSLAWTNAGTFFGAVCFLVAAWLFGYPSHRSELTDTREVAE